MKYQEAYNKIIEAYFKDEIKPYSGEFCFCGTLNNNNHRWRESKFYSFEEFKKMEKSLLHEIVIGTVGYGVAKNIYVDNDHTDKVRWKIKNHPSYENALFAGMSAALDVLKQIHIERGEIIDESLQLTKRNICEKQN